MPVEGINLLEKIFAPTIYPTRGKNPSVFKSMLNSIDNQPTYSEKSGLGRWCWQGAGFRGAGAHKLVDMPEKIKTEKLLF
jgi:hypothetical protein